jgi:hypothetical protein
MLNSADYCLVWEAETPAPAVSPRASSSGQRVNLCLWALLAAMNLFDVLATGRAFDIGIGELNPIVDALHAEFGLAGITALKAAFLTLLLFLLPFIRTWTRALFALTCSAYLALTVAHIGFLSPLL